MKRRGKIPKSHSYMRGRAPADKSPRAAVQTAGLHSSFGTSNNNAWLGTPNGTDNAYYVNSNGNVNNNNTNNDYVLAPVFTIPERYVFQKA